ncbi:hypothetical protein P350_33970 [Burkholderia cepacia JBK9]|nr:hypothetical protein P350_33970 [Burkholderia cepacia JBK9]
MLFRSSVKADCENATMPSQCALAMPIMPCRHPYRMTPCDDVAPARSGMVSIRGKGRRAAAT